MALVGEGFFAESVLSDACAWVGLAPAAGQLAEQDSGELGEGDRLAYALSHLVNAGHRVVMHIHDEVVIDAPQYREW